MTETGDNITSIGLVEFVLDFTLIPIERLHEDRRYPESRFGIDEGLQSRADASDMLHMPLDPPGEFRSVPSLVATIRDGMSWTGSGIVALGGVKVHCAELSLTLKWSYEGLQI